MAQLSSETLKAMKDQVEHAKAVGQRNFLINPESVSTLIEEVERQAREIERLKNMEYVPKATLQCRGHFD